MDRIHQTALEQSVRILELPPPASSIPSLKSPSFYKPRRAYTAPRKRKTKPAYLALGLLAGMAVYFFLFPSLWVGKEAARFTDDGMLVGLNIEEHRHTHVNVHHHYHNPAEASASQSRLTTQQQLAALTSFILSPLHSNSVAALSSDDFRIEDLLEFSMDSPRAPQMLREMVQDTWSEEKVVIFGKHHHPPTRVLQNLLKSWDFPAPSVIELDKRADGAVLDSVLRRMTFPIRFEDDAETEWALPLLIIRGTPVFGLDAIKRLQDNGELDRLLEDDSR